MIEARGVLHKCNHLTLTELLNPVDEYHTMSNIMDDNIFAAVMRAEEAQENMESTGTDDVDDENDAVEDYPKAQEVIQASGLIGKYIAALDNPIAWRLESLLGGLNCGLHLEATSKLKDTRLTDYFKCT
ncbi:hypothetical protein CONPUDRAFT_52729 [Coniophora puteana RWD-64-598 SS2]|uniref:Uncharacterized protein n=1 Tax=Coniophora puteana (strain RWD-64-598) TaxID=741705 RepID=A0A5M3MUU9_CONPW|nr:uncharacterized protein CONPUDRAFT_52729 [Coniophora puteana RWD-64-598 SS2]EIW82948.1 hypothetical protein CONPUDRAFT_52729 [Coniophora puteana RWD-64-598 SS2]